MDFSPPPCRPRLGGLSSAWRNSRPIVFALLFYRVFFFRQWVFFSGCRVRAGVNHSLHLRCFFFFQNTNELYICTHTQYLFRVHCKKKMYVKEETYCRSLLLAFSLGCHCCVWARCISFSLSYKRCCFHCMPPFISAYYFLVFFMKSKSYVYCFWRLGASLTFVLPFLYTSPTLSLVRSWKSCIRLVHFTNVTPIAVAKFIFKSYCLQWITCFMLYITSRS